MTSVGRNDSLANGWFREANLQRQLSGDETGDVSVATRPHPDLQPVGREMVAIKSEQSYQASTHWRDLCPNSLSQLESPAPALD